MKSYADLSTVHRTEPCREYPGEWIVYQDGTEYGKADDLYAAKDLAYELIQHGHVDPCNVSICWSCSENDPRIGMVWFTPFYQHGRFNAFGQYRET